MKELGRRISGQRSNSKGNLKRMGAYCFELRHLFADKGRVKVGVDIKKKQDADRCKGSQTLKITRGSKGVWHQSPLVGVRVFLEDGEKRGEGRKADDEKSHLYHNNQVEMSGGCGKRINGSDVSRNKPEMRQILNQIFWEGGNLMPKTFCNKRRGNKAGIERGKAEGTERQKPEINGKKRWGRLST